MLLYVDNKLIDGMYKQKIKDLKSKLSNEFETKDFGATDEILGMWSCRDRSKKRFEFVSRVC